jgi:nucleotide-binding universal stress UspA family protein
VKRIKRIIWAVDPFELDRSVKSHSLRVLEAIVKRVKAEVEPVTVISDGMLGVPLRNKETSKQLKADAEKALKSYLSHAKVSHKKDPVLLWCVPSSMGTAAESLDRYAQKRKADLILVSSHGNVGFKRAFLGSFAETLVLHSKTPILISGPHAKSVFGKSQILFPTDLSKKSKKALLRTHALAKKLNMGITLFHARPDYLDPVLQSGAALFGAGFVSVHDYAGQEDSDVRKELDKWAVLASKGGVKVNVVLDQDSRGVANSILAYAEKNEMGMIAMASESGALSATILGSIGRMVAREAVCPVLFMRR